MRRSVHCSSVHYAVIEASRNNDHPEHLVIAYLDEKCLRDLIAAPSIVALGFASREQAMASLAAVKQDSVAIHFTWNQDWPAVSKLLSQIERELEPYNPRPHWGKLFTMLPPHHFS